MSNAIQAKQKTVKRLERFTPTMPSILEKGRIESVTEILYHVLRRENVATYSLDMDAEGFVRLKQLQDFFEYKTDEDFTSEEVWQAVYDNAWFSIRTHPETGNWQVKVILERSCHSKPVDRSELMLDVESFCSDSLSSARDSASSDSLGSEDDSASLPRGREPSLIKIPPLPPQSRMTWVGKAGEAKAAWLKAQELDRWSDENESIWDKNDSWSGWESHDSWQGWRWDNSWRTWHTDRPQWEREHWRDCPCSDASVQEHRSEDDWWFPW